MASRAFTEEDVKNVRDNIFPSLPSYKPDGTIASSDIPELCEKLGWERTPEQLKAYQDYWDEHHGGRAHYELGTSIGVKSHTTGPWFREFVTACDRNGDGYIQKEDFELFFKIFNAHHPGSKASYNDFIKEADVNQDGKVSIDEAVAWVEKQNA